MADWKFGLVLPHFGQHAWVEKMSRQSYSDLVWRLDTGRLSARGSVWRRVAAGANHFGDLYKAHGVSPGSF
jgi:hypothetical protein